MNNFDFIMILLIILEIQVICLYKMIKERRKIIMDNYKKDKGYIKQRLEYVSSVDYISELEEQIEDLQNENERLNNMLENDSNKNLELIVLINKISDIVEDKNITGFEVRLKIQEILGGDEWYT